MHDLGGTGHQLTDMYAGNACLDCAKWTPKLGIGFRVPTFQLAHTTIDPDKQNLFLFLFQLLGHHGLNQSCRPQIAITTT